MILLMTVASLIFAIIVYAIGYYGGNTLVNKFDNKRGRFFKGVFKARILFNKYSKRSLLALRLIPFSRIYVALISGACKQDFYFYLFASFIGFLIWNTIFVSLGVSIFINFDHIIKFYEEAKILILIIVSATIISILIRAIYKKRGEVNEENGKDF